MQEFEVQSMHDTTITLFNRIPGEAYENDTYIATVIENVTAKLKYGAVSTVDGDEKSDSAMFSIRKDFLHDVSYREPKQYLSEIDKSGLFTLSKGDIIVVGDVKSEVMDSTDLLKYLRNRYDNVFEIQAVSTFNLIPHWEVTAI